FNEGGLEKLLDKKTPPGKSPYLTEEQQKKLKHMILHSTPFEQGLGMATSWDTRIIPSYLQNQYGISMTRVGVNKMLHRLGLSYTRPTYTLAKGDEQKQRAFVQEMEMIKKLMTGDMVVLYADETHIRSYQALRATWAEAGKQKQIPTYGHHASVTLFGAVNVLDGKVVVQQASACNTGSFLEVVQRILQTYQGKYVLLVLDNARIHHAKQVQEFLRKHEEPIMFFFLPPYSPHLNGPLDLHVLGTPPAFVLSQDQTLQKESRLASASAPAPFDASRLRFSMWTLRFVQFSRNIHKIMWSG
ncbi:IS630 family transposase, partial [Parageobacillus thermoglucosidasius]|uniref:IS630 family transposase n=1 Tax=Parageobacillus thermoglucosidasius TaxID=1426 RepID=UPI0021AB97DB